MHRVAAIAVLALLAAPPHATVGVRATQLGRVLADARGHTLYVFDGGACSGACARTWPPFLTTGKPTGIAHLGTKRLAGGKLQVTFAGKPLYFYVGDSGAGQVAGASVPHWSALSPTGKALHDAPATTTPVTTTPGYGDGGY